MARATRRKGFAMTKTTILAAAAALLGVRASAQSVYTNYYHWQWTPVEIADTNAVNAVRVCDCRSLAVVRAEDMFDKLSVSEVASDKDGDTDKECNHVMPSC